ncbi:MAG: carboxypeptidase-like regulatory domain-containing protein [Spirosomataceae bacterium]
MKKIATLLLFIIFSIEFANAQQFMLHGRIIDAQSREEVVGVVVSSKNTATTTDSRGLFALMATKNDTVSVSMIGYEKYVFLVQNEDSVTIKLKTKSTQLSELIVKADKLSNLQTPGRLEIRKDILQKSHGLLEDPMQTITKMPGVARVGDLFTPSQIYIRGGSPDEILFLLDNTPVSWPWYFGGQKSMFNTDIIKDIELITGGFSAAFGNYLSSVMNVSLKDGSFQETHGSVSMGIYNAQGYMETPLIKNKFSLLLAARSTYIDKVLKNASFPTPSLFDANVKLAYQVNPKNLITFTNTISDESVDYQSNDDGVLTKIWSKGKKNTQSLMWQGQISDKVYNKLIFTHNANQDDFELDDSEKMEITSNTFGFRNDLTFFLSQNNLIKTGLEGYSTKYAIDGFEVIRISLTNPAEPTQNQNVYQIEDKLARMGAYVLYEGKIWGKLQTNSGLRWDTNLTNGTISPRIKLVYPFKNTSIHTSWGEYYQFAGIGVKNANELPASKATHYILGIKQRMNSQFSGWAEIYLKDYSTLYLVRDGGNYEATGEGSSRGIEFFLEKNQGKIQGWLSYSLSKSERINAFDKKLYDASFDQRHIFNTNLEWQISKGNSYLPSSLQAIYRFETGRPYTPTISGFRQNDAWFPVRGAINSLRYPNYNNLNIRIEWLSTMKKARNLKSYFEIWNVLDAKNPIGLTTRFDESFTNSVKQTFSYAFGRLFGGGVIFGF